MIRRIVALAFVTMSVASCDNDDTTAPSQTDTSLSFFVTSSRSSTGNLGGLSGADSRCQTLALAAGAGAKRWRAYLSVQQDPGNGNRPTDARNRIGRGPWFNARGVMVASDVNSLHARQGDVNVFVDERGQPINGAWAGSPTPNEHDILTGSAADGSLLPGFTCNDWTSDSATLQARVGHSDGMGGTPPTVSTSWNSAHDNGSCANTAPRGGAGRIYCFAAN